jgi:hypothetical protein
MPLLFSVFGEEKLFLTLVNLASLSHDFCPPLILRYVAAGCAGVVCRSVYDMWGRENYLIFGVSCRLSFSTTPFAAII